MKTYKIITAHGTMVKIDANDILEAINKALINYPILSVTDIVTVKQTINY